MVSLMDRSIGYESRLRSSIRYILHILDHHWFLLPEKKSFPFFLMKLVIFCKYFPFLIRILSVFIKKWNTLETIEKYK